MTNQNGAAGNDSYRSDIDRVRRSRCCRGRVHVGFTLFGGGFVGVDIFFVISWVSDNPDPLREVGVLAGCGCWSSMPGGCAVCFQLLRSWCWRRWSPGISSCCRSMNSPICRLPTRLPGIFNVYFENAANDYFAGPAEEQPLLHLWSLAVEEQYYLGGPRSSSDCGRRETKRLPTARPPRRRWSVDRCIVCLCVVMTAKAPGIAFDYLPTRAWELGVGSLLAIALNESRSRDVNWATL